MPVTKSSEESVCSQCGAEVFEGICTPCAFGELVNGAGLSTLRDDGTPIDVPFGKYTLKRRLASGGMGVIYEAWDPELKRTVALKMIRGSTFANREEVARFMIEAEAVAGLDNPHIVPIFEVGSMDQQPFFTMKLIEGQSLAAMLDCSAERKLPAKRVAMFLSQIAQAVQHAHQRGVLHRDLKPANILIDANDACWLTDFGLAKMEHDNGGLTRSTDHLGTTNYMSPEVVKGSSAKVSTASDVWALGVILWEMLCGELPFSGDHPVETMRKIVEEEPDGHGTDRDLLTLARRCLEKDPARRLPSAGAVAEELERWLQGKPLTVRPVTLTERTLKWIRRQPAKAALIAGLLVTLIVGGVSTAISWQRAERAVESLTASLSESTATKLALEARLQIDTDPQRALLLAVEAVEECENQDVVVPSVYNRSVEALYETLEKVGGRDVSPFDLRADQDETLPGGATAANIPLAPCLSPDGRWLVSFDASQVTDMGVVAALFDLRDSETEPVRRWKIWETMGGPYLNQTRWLPDSQRLISIDHEGQVIVWTLLESANSEVPPFVVAGQVSTASSDTLYFYLPPMAETDAFLRLSVLQWEKENTELVHRKFRVEVDSGTLGEEVAARRVIPGATRSERQYNISPDQRWMVGQRRREHLLVDLETPGDEADVSVLGGKVSMNLRRFSPNSRWLISQESGTEITSVDLTAGSFEAILQSRLELCRVRFNVLAFGFYPNSDAVFVAGDSHLKVLSISEPASDSLANYVPDRLQAFTISADGKWLAIGGGNERVRVWLIEDFLQGEPPMELLGMHGRFRHLAFSAGNDSIVAAGPVGRYRQWRFRGASPGASPALYALEDRSVRDVAVSPDGEWIAVATSHRDDLDHSEVSYQKGEYEGEAFLLRKEGEQTVMLGKHRGRCTGVAFSRDGRWVASTGLGGVVMVWEMNSIREGEALLEPTHVLRMTDTKLFGGFVKHRMGRRRQLAFHPRGTLYVTSGTGVVFEWDLTVPDPAKTVEVHFLSRKLSHLPDIDISPDGRWLAVGHYEEYPRPRGIRFQEVLLFDVSKPGQPSEEAKLKANFRKETEFAFTPDSQWLAAGSYQGAAVCIWHLQADDIAASRRECPLAMGTGISSLSFSPNGKHLAMINPTTGLHLWEWQKDVAGLQTLSGRSVSGAVSWLDRDHLLMGAVSGLGRWDLDLSRLKALARQVANRELSGMERQHFLRD